MENDHIDEFDGPSKSQRKRDAHKQQELGVRLTQCSEAQLRTLKIPEKTISAIAEYNRLPNSHGARRRQLQFIGKLMRDSDFDEINAALERLLNPASHIPKPKPVADSLLWTDKILANGDEIINTLVDTHTQLERQKLRQLYREYQAAKGDTQAQVRFKLQRYLQPVLDT